MQTLKCITRMTNTKDEGLEVYDIEQGTFNIKWTQRMKGEMIYMFIQS